MVKISAGEFSDTSAYCILSDHQCACSTTLAQSSNAESLSNKSVGRPLFDAGGRLHLMRHNTRKKCIISIGINDSPKTPVPI